MIETTVSNTARRYSLFEKGGTVTVALSGGADSMALLTALVNLSSKYGITVKAAHLNHLIRGEEAFRDEEFVKSQCARLDVALVCERANIPDIAKKRGESLELAARKVRYEFLERINEGLIATAHTASDNLETVLMNLIRGSSIDGLCGIPVKRGIFIRPLLFCSRSIVEEYCEIKNIPYVNDSTNFSDEYTRNKIRHNIIPVLKELNSGVENTVLRSCQSLKEISCDLKTAADMYLKDNLFGNKLSLDGFSKLPLSVAKKVIVMYVKCVDSSIDLENKHIDEIYKICLTKGKTSIPKKKSCLVSNNLLSISLDGISEDNKEKYIVDISVSDNDFLNKNQKVNNLLLKNSLDCDKIVGKLVTRTRLPGDTIRLKNRGCTKPLTKLYNECGIPVRQRNSLPVIADDNGVVWIYGIGTAHRCSVSESTKKIYKIEVKILENGNGTIQK